LVAEQQLAKESGPIRLASVQARLTQCYYLLTQSRVNHCWRTFGTVSQLSLATGLNRSTRSAASSIELECRRRTFWCAYTLDVHLSVVLGRPQLFHDEDIDAELPTDIEDDRLIESQHATSGVSSGLSTMLAPLAHIKYVESATHWEDRANDAYSLARIVKSILRQLYPLKPITASHRSDSTARISDSLTKWRSALISFLDTENFSASLFLPIVQRQRNVLNLTYWHATILTNRPFLLNSFGENGRVRDVSDKNLLDQTEQSVQQCLQSAMKTVEIINQMTQSGQMYRAFWVCIELRRLHPLRPISDKALDRGLLCLYCEYRTLHICHPQENKPSRGLQRIHVSCCPMPVSDIEHCRERIASRALLPLTGRTSPRSDSPD
jgi:hypothetical protein